MNLRVLADYNWESKLDHAKRPLDLREPFASKEYGSDLRTLVICLMCRSSHLNFRQRVRYEKAEATMYLDVMLNVEQFVVASHKQRRELLASALIKDVPETLAKRKFKAFDLAAFERDLKETVEQQLCTPEASRFDHLCLERATGYGS